MLDATDAFVARRPDFPIKIGIYSFSSSVRQLLPIQPYDRAAIRSRAGAPAAPRRRHGDRRGDARGAARSLSRRRVPQVPAGRHRRREHQRPRARTTSRARSSRKSEGARADLFRRVRHEPGEVRVSQGGRRRRHRRRHRRRSCARRSTASTRARFSPRRSTPASGNRSRSNYVGTMSKEISVILQKFWSAFVAQINKVANMFWEADPIAQMRYEYDQRGRAAQGGPRRARAVSRPGRARHAAGVRQPVARAEARGRDQGLPEGRRSRDRGQVRARAAEGEGGARRQRAAAPDARDRVRQQPEEDPARERAS